MQPPQNPYNQPPLSNPSGGSPFQPAPPGISSTTTLIITGILGIVCCGFLAPYTWIKSNQALQSVNSGYGNIAEASTYNVTKILGIIGTVLWIIGVIAQIGTIGAAISSANNPRNRPSMSAPPTP